MRNTIIQNYSPLRERNFRTYIIGQAISLIGTWLQSTAQAWVVWEISHSEAALGIVAMLNSLPILLLSPWAGVLADRVNRRWLLIATQTMQMILAFMLAALTQFGWVQLWHVYILTLLLGVTAALDFPAQQAFLGDLSGLGEVRKAVNINATILQVSRMLGPALAGWVITVLGTATAFWVNGASFIAVIISLLMVESEQRILSRARTSVWAEMTDAMRFVKYQPRMQDLFIFVSIVTFFGFSSLSIMPSFASVALQGDAQTLGLVLAASGAGALASTLVFVPLLQARRRVGLGIGLMVAWMGLWLLLTSGMRWLPFAMVGIFAFSIGAPMVVATSLGLVQTLAPVEMRARLLSLFTMVSFGVQPVASLVVGFTAQQIGTPLAITVNGAMMILCAVAMLTLRPQLRTWEMHYTPTVSQVMRQPLK